MPVIMMTNENNPNAVKTTYGDTVVYMETTYVGCVLSTYENNGYDDSDFYANVWDEAGQCVKSIQYATTRGWTYPNYATVDATPEVKEKALAYKKRKFAEWEAQKAEREAECATKGREVTVKVSKGKNKHLDGQTGSVFWFGEDQYRRRGYRVGVQFASGEKVFFAADRVTVVGSDIDADEAQRSLNSFHNVSHYMFNWTIGLE
jgi:hypothetical protein